jgi:tetratricopeptide (TPR) repeat protein
MDTDSPETLRRAIWDMIESRDHSATLTAIELTSQLPPPGDAPDELTAQCIFDAGFAIEFFGDDAAAIELYRRVLRYRVVDTKYTASAWFRTGVCTGRQGNLAEAIECYRESLRLARNLPHLTALACFYLAGLLEAAEDYEAAAQLYERFLPMLPHPDIDAQKAHLGYARCSWRIGRDDLAVEELTAIARERDDPLSVEAWRLLAEIAEARKDFRAAEHAYRQIIASSHAEVSLRAAAAYRLAAASAQSTAKD